MTTCIHVAVGAVRLLLGVRYKNVPFSEQKEMRQREVSTFSRGP